jgi:DNA-binding MarR family transcriptional regulator
MTRPNGTLSAPIEPVEPLCPEGRRSSPTKPRGGREVVNIESYIPYLLSSINNALSGGASQFYLTHFNVGIVEWRVISMLAIEPRILASHICDVVSLDKAATSRALKRLEARGLVEFEASATDPRRRLLWLSESGYDMHDRILGIALERERQLIRGAEPDDLEAMLRVMRIMRRNVGTIEVAR